MAQKFSEHFYKTQAWVRCRNAYAAKVGWLCEDCLERGLIVPLEEVHHIVELTPENVSDPKITLGFDNLRGLCRECHKARHAKEDPKRYTVDEFGRVKIK